MREVGARDRRREQGSVGTGSLFQLLRFWGPGRSHGSEGLEKLGGCGIRTDWGRGWAEGRS